jgi:hypothetical protein
MYIFRDTSSALWQAFKARAAREGRPLKALLELLIRRYVQNGVDDNGD